MGDTMDVALGVGIALLVTLPITVTIVGGMLFAFFARVHTYALVPTVGSLHMNVDRTLSEDDDAEHILAA